MSLPYYKVTHATVVNNFAAQLGAVINEDVLKLELFDPLPPFFENIRVTLVTFFGTGGVLHSK